MADGTTNIKVAVRVRPYNRRELEVNQRSIIKVMDGTTLLFDPDEEDDEFFFQGAKQNYRDITKRVNKKISMEFDRVFDTDSTNIQIFHECTSPLVDYVLNGYNCSVFVYGATGAGKTFTMLGSSEFPGLTFLTMRDLFDKIEAQSDVRKFDVGVSYLEVYNEHVMNLLTKTGPLKLREDSNGVVVSGLVLKPIYSAEELLELLALGNSHRTQHPTDANAESSRSHAIFQVHIRMTDRKTGTKRTVKLSMIDLAGSERAASTKGVGVRFKEGASINKSLLALGNCINKLADGLKHIPYRDSNLTRILKDSLGGNCRTLMVANVSMSSLTYEDTYNTLKYASRAKKIRTTSRQNAMKSNMPKDFYVRKVNELMAEVDRLKEANKALETKVTATQKTNASDYNDTELNPWYSKMDDVYAHVIATQEHVTDLQSKIKNSLLHKKLKEQVMTYNKLLSLSHSDNQENVSVFSAWIERFSKQIEKQKEELTRWRCKLQEAYKSLEHLKIEIRASKFGKILRIYKKSKDLELENLIRKINIEHITNINSEFVVDAQKLREAFVLACEVLRSAHDELLVEDKLNAELRNGYERLQILLRSHSIYDYRKDSSDEDYEMPEMKILLNGKRMRNVDGGIGATRAANGCAKRQRHKKHAAHVHAVANDEDNDDDYHLEMDSIVDDTDSDPADQCAATAPSVSIFKMPVSQQQHAGGAGAGGHLNETHVLSAGDVTFDASTSASRMSRKKNLVANILSEQIVRVPDNKEQLKSILVKSKNFSREKLLKTVAAGVQKENKKFSPVRVRKSPRSVGPKVFNNVATNLLKRHAATALGGVGVGVGARNHGDAPTVRINRAASFRFKK